MRRLPFRELSCTLLLAALSLCPAAALRAQCLDNTTADLGRDGRWFAHGIAEAPRNAIRAHNLKWEIPIAATTAALIAAGDSPGSRLIDSPSLQRQASRWSNIGLALELGGAGGAYLIGCVGHHDALREAGQTALEAAGAALFIDEAIKVVTNRQRPPSDNSDGEFWDGGKSFASGHAAMSFAVASVIAHRYRNRRWLKWGAYGLAAGVSLARYPAKQHFFSDILIGGTLGYITGTYLSSPQNTPLSH